MYYDYYLVGHEKPLAKEHKSVSNFAWEVKLKATSTSHSTHSGCECVTDKINLSHLRLSSQFIKSSWQISFAERYLSYFLCPLTAVCSVLGTPHSAWSANWWIYFEQRKCAYAPRRRTCGHPYSLNCSLNISCNNISITWHFSLLSEAFRPIHAEYFTEWHRRTSA